MNAKPTRSSKPLIIRCNAAETFSGYTHLTPTSRRYFVESYTDGRLNWTHIKEKASLFPTVELAKLFLKSIKHSGIGVEIVYA